MTVKNAQFTNETNAIFLKFATNLCNNNNNNNNKNNKTAVNAVLFEGMPPLTPHKRERSIIGYMNTVWPTWPRNVALDSEKFKIS